METLAVNGQIVGVANGCASLLKVCAGWKILGHGIRAKK